MMRLADNFMSTKAMSISVEVIALDFYDGVTEGIALAVKDCGNCYFKLIAWDQKQDERLYVVSEIHVSQYTKLFELLTRSRESPPVSVWLPEWKFRDDNDEQKADSIINSFRINSRLSKLLVLGKDIKDSSSRTFAVNDELRSEVVRVLDRDEIGDLANWLPLLNLAQSKSE